MIKSKKLSKIKNLRHGFFNSVGGKSKSIYKSLNCGPGSNDKKLNVKKNLEIVRKKISKKAKDIFLLQQVHSNKFVYINDKYNIKKKFKADAVITNQRNLPIAVLTADCSPILIYDKKMKIVAAIHAGWKGAYKGIINKVIKFMVKKGCELKNMIAAMIFFFLSQIKIGAQSAVKTAIGKFLWLVITASTFGFFFNLYLSLI
jgi:copper oxidase (laccase) domain-containing protein